MPQKMVSLRYPDFMRPRILLILFIILIVPAFSFAAIFTVTSNADSGPGTLREALTLAAANGSAEKDYIYFNLPDLSEAGRTITISTGLPYISSNLVIDGTSQPGVRLGRSDAKITLQPADPQSQFNTFVLVDVDGFEIYGMYVRDFTGSISNGPSQGVPTSAAVLYIETSKNVIVGAPGKGNVFVNNGYIESTTYVSIKDGSSLPAFGVDNFQVQSNIFGFEPDGKTYRGNDYGYRGGFDLNYCKGNIAFGGDGNKRNIFGNGAMYITGYFTGRERLFTSNFLIENNYFNYDIDGNPSPLPNLNASNIYALFFSIDRWIFPYEDISYPYTFKITNNKIQYPYTVTVGRTSGEIVFQGNKLLKEANPSGQSYTGGVGFSSTERVLVGGEQPGEANIIYGSLVGLMSRKSVLLQRNSIFCMNEDRGPWYPMVPYLGEPLPLPTISIDKVTSLSVSGTATPLSKIELFWDDDCQNCQPLSYITTIQADAGGKWVYNGIVQKGVIASATLNGFTSLFTTSAVLNSAEVQHTACGKNDGYIKPVLTNAGGYLWKNEAGDQIATTAEVKNLAPGKYTLTAQNGTCSNDYTFEILDATPQIYDGNIQIAHPSCNAKGSITYLFLSNNIPQNEYGAYSYKWLDANNNVKGTDIDLREADAGSYRLEVSYKNNCKVLYGPVILHNVDGPSINEANKTITSSPCAASTGSINGITATGTNIKYSWKNEQQQEVGASADLTNQPPGKYTLTITDDSQCGPVSTLPIEIPAISDISINTTNKVVKNATCSNADGSITGIQVTGSGTLTYTWTNEQGQVAAQSRDLPAAVAGKYTLTVTGATCPPVMSQPIEIFSVGGVTIDNNNISGQAATSCTPGFIKGITSPNATSASWKRLADGAIMSTTFDLLDAVAGQYELTLSNATCSKTFPFTIDQLPATVFPDFPATYTRSCFSFGSGTITLNTDNATSQPSEYIWRNEQGERVGYDKKVEFLPAGKYKLYLRDITGCESFYKEYNVETYPKFKAVFGAYDNIYCGVGKGAIKAAVVTGGTGNYVYEWRDGAGNVIPGETQPFLNNLEPGNYTLSITDGGCNLAELTYPIIATDRDVPAPVAENVSVCGAGNVVIHVIDPYITALYRLYDSPTAAQPLSEQMGGQFNVTVTESRSYYIALAYGTCESPRTEVEVTLGSIAGTIPNTFTPNGDGFNDYWALKGFENYPNGIVKVFNRAGQLVFQSTGYTKPFDGTWAGKPLAPGTYYYIIDLKSCNILSGSVTIIR